MQPSFEVFLDEKLNSSDLATTNPFDFWTSFLNEYNKKGKAGKVEALSYIAEKIKPLSDDLNNLYDNEAVGESGSETLAENKDNKINENQSISLSWRTANSQHAFDQIINVNSSNKENPLKSFLFHDVNSAKIIAEIFSKVTKLDFGNNANTIFFYQDLRHNDIQFYLVLLYGADLEKERNTGFYKELINSRKSSSTYRAAYFFPTNAQNYRKTIKNYLKKMNNIEDIRKLIDHRLNSLTNPPKKTEKEKLQNLKNEFKKLPLNYEEIKEILVIKEKNDHEITKTQCFFIALFSFLSNPSPIQNTSRKPSF